MSATALYKDIKARTSQSKHLHSKAESLESEGKLDESRTTMGEAMAKDEEIREWMRGILSSRVIEVCQLVRNKNWPNGISRLPDAVTEASYPEVISALSLFSDLELEKYLSPDCMTRFRGIR